MISLAPSPPSTRAADLPTFVGWAVSIAIAMSTQYLFQPFVWMNWPVDEVLRGWIEVALERIVVAVPIALAVYVVARKWRPLSIAGMAALAIATVIGAATGEACARLLGPGSPFDAAALARNIAHWTLLSAAIAATWVLWARTTASRARAQSIELRRLEAERELTESRLQLLRNQIEPHFLFNTLATVRLLHATSPERGSQLLAHLIDYLKLTASNLESPRRDLARELGLVRSYLGVIGIRMGGRLATRIDVPDELLDCAFPPLTLATLVENAVKHGIAPRPGVGEIRISARRVGDAIEAEVADTGIGFGQTVGGGIGLSNIRARLRVLYGDRARLALTGNKPSGVRATIRVPYVAATER